MTGPTKVRLKHREADSFPVLELCPGQERGPVAWHTHTHRPTAPGNGL